MDFSTEPPDYWKTIVAAVLSSSSYEHQIFKSNLDVLIEKNLSKTGVDPRIKGPPVIKGQNITRPPTERKLEEKKVKLDPHFWQ